MKENCSTIRCLILILWRFHSTLKAPLSAKKIARMEKLYGFNAVKNAEIRFRWLRLGLRARLEETIPRALEFATEQGRMKFTRPIFRYVQ